MVIGFCIGNGLSIDLQHKYFEELSSFNTYQFFSWNVKSPIANRSFMCDLPRLNERLSITMNTNNDFEVVESIIEECQITNADFNDTVLLCELQHYIAHAFSTYQNKIDKLEISDWHWARWLDYHRENLGYFVSFNYDLILERALESVRIPYRRIGPLNEQEGICILKPHGSIDFEIAPGNINVPMSYPLKNAVLKNNCSIISLDKSKWLSIRKEVDIVLPNEYSTQLEYQWVKPGYDVIENEGYLFTHFIFAGISYCKYDQEEINFIIENLRSETKIIVVNPNPREELMKALNDKFNTVEVWSTGLKNLK